MPNQNSNCDYWAEQGYCQHSYVDYMTTNCKMSCGLCSSSCQNENSNCELWANQGYCSDTTYVSYMEENCKNSCEKCIIIGI